MEKETKHGEARHSEARLGTPREDKAKQGTLWGRLSGGEHRNTRRAEGTARRAKARRGKATSGEARRPERWL